MTDDRSLLPDPAGRHHRHLPPLGLAEWVVFTLLAGLLAAANVYTTLLIGWGDTGSIIAVLLSVVLLAVVRPGRPSIAVLNLGQTMVSAGGSVGFAVACYAAVRIIDPSFDPPTPWLIALFAAMGVLGAILGTTVRKAMVRYYFPSGTACAVIQRSITEVLAPGQKSRPIFLLKLWGSIAALVSIPAKITIEQGGAALLKGVELLGKEGQAWFGKGVGVGVDPLYYGIGIVVGPRVGLGMLLGALASPFLIMDGLAARGMPDAPVDWVRWLAIALLTLPTFATIIFAYLFRQPAVVPPGFEPGRTAYAAPANRVLLYGLLGTAAAAAIGVCAHQIFGLPWYAAVVTMIVAWPLCVVNGRVAGETDINPVRLVAIVILGGLFWMVAGAGPITMLGMAVVGGTLAAVAVDMMQDYRTGYLLDANPVHQTTVQFAGSLAGALVAVPVLGMLIAELGVGPDSQLPAPGAQVWAAMAQAMVGGFNPSAALTWAIVITSVAGCGYAFLTVWPRSAAWMPSLFGAGIGLLVGIPTSAAIFGGGLLKWLITLAYRAGKRGAEREEATTRAGNDTMLAGASVFAVSAILSILLVLATRGLDLLGLDWFHLAK